MNIPAEKIFLRASMLNKISIFSSFPLIMVVHPETQSAFICLVRSDSGENQSTGPEPMMDGIFRT
ncbi:hypothetical protein SAMN02745124_00800 [Desulfofustis glycolicus DSM 9705]|uniref:Uncharacterized protein n=1 Tax=Desulfofustis glycolicus DSM 9705 TaxID=1121409 RepID=A0A1M5TMA9_9BACT|nr:hypothetical protein SAMN02745124_00800 [Desulfofustis glycolicus DSM 9705]